MITFLFLCAIPTTLGFATSSHYLSHPSHERQLSRPHNNLPAHSIRPAPARRHSSPAQPSSAARAASTTRLYNFYDDWSLDRLSSSQSEYTYDDLNLMLDEEFIEQCLEELMDSDYGKTMFGRHDMPASVGITGSIEFESLEGPEAILSLSGKFWHRRETVLGKAAMYLNARMPELQSIRVSSPEELSDFEDIIDEYTGAIIAREDKRAPDFNGDRNTMEYQGLNPDDRGPFVVSIGGDFKIRPA
eukprot:CAMPEP_0201965208 /NCGR_PEP_ID=MMETSP0904-20121228/10575_1 /ASSEMBLY_ACC=CAM_ASM_000553 /TAXON_ID=420261 /ORGANISM="Thalassiosira antarctica, Strain CCMP982" /LENGTH=244 /DNA_ID=CAMNT_0048512221 /DNA_START=1 /DNA_END=735 /DNA_ORIENTATION=+